MEPGQDYADLIDAASIEVGRLESTNGSGRKTISDVLEKISWVHEHLKTQEKSEKQKQIFKRALNVLKTLYQKLHKKKKKNQDESKTTPTSMPSRENETTGATTAATTGGAPTKSYKSGSQEKPSIDEIPLAMKCEPVAAMTNCNSRCIKGKIKCKEDLQGKAFHEDVNYFSSKMLSESKYVSIFFKSNQGYTTCGSLAARKWRENEKMKRKWRENEEMEGKWREIYSLHFPIFSLLPPHSCLNEN